MVAYIIGYIIGYMKMYRSLHHIRYPSRTSPDLWSQRQSTISLKHKILLSKMNLQHRCNLLPTAPSILPTFSNFSKMTYKITIVFSMIYHIYAFYEFTNILMKPFPNHFQYYNRYYYNHPLFM